VNAFELSESLVPADLRAMWNEYKEKMASEGKTVKTGGGFGGSGFKFDENEASYTTEKKKFQKTVFGLQVSNSIQLHIGRKIFRMYYYQKQQLHISLCDYNEQQFWIFMYSKYY
jgi:hypothetical protein